MCIYLSPSPSPMKIWLMCPSLFYSHTPYYSGLYRVWRSKLRPTPSPNTFKTNMTFRNKIYLPKKIHWCNNSHIHLHTLDFDYFKLKLSVFFYLIQVTSVEKLWPIIQNLIDVYNPLYSSFESFEIWINKNSKQEGIQNEICFAS